MGVLYSFEREKPPANFKEIAAYKYARIIENQYRFDNNRSPSVHPRTINFMPIEIPEYAGKYTGYYIRVYSAKLTGNKYVLDGLYESALNDKYKSERLQKIYGHALRSAKIFLEQFNPKPIMPVIDNNPER